MKKPGRRRRSHPLLTIRKGTRKNLSYKLDPDCSIQIDVGSTNILVTNRGPNAVYLGR